MPSAELERRTLEEAGTRWTYLASTGEGPPLLMLTGALGEADFGSDLLQRLASQLRLVAPDYPAVGDLDAFMAGLAAILDVEGIDRAHVHGGSFGGLIAQSLAAERPERVRSLLLSHSGAPRRAPRAALVLLKLMPGRLLRALFRKRLRPAVAIAGPGAVARFEAAVDRLGKGGILARVQLAFEIGRRHGGAETAPFPGSVLLIQADDDPLISAADQAFLAKRFPQAQSHRFSGTGHLAALLQPEGFAEEVLKFIRQADQPKG